MTDEQKLAALKAFIAHEVEDMTINHLGDPEKQQRVINGRAALKGSPAPDPDLPSGNRNKYTGRFR